MKCLEMVFKQKFAQQLLLNLMWSALRCNRKLLHVPFLLWKNKMLKSNCCCTTGGSHSQTSNPSSVYHLDTPWGWTHTAQTEGMRASHESTWKSKKSCSEKPVLQRQRCWELYLRTSVRHDSAASEINDRKIWQHALREEVVAVPS